MLGTVNCEAAPVWCPSKLSSQPRGSARAVEQGCNFRHCLFLGMVTLLKVWLKYEKNAHRASPSCSCATDGRRPLGLARQLAAISRPSSGSSRRTGRIARCFRPKRSKSLGAPLVVWRYAGRVGDHKGEAMLLQIGRARCLPTNGGAARVWVGPSPPLFQFGAGRLGLLSRRIGLTAVSRLVVGRAGSAWPRFGAKDASE